MTDGVEAREGDEGGPSARETLMSGISLIPKGEAAPEPEAAPEEFERAVEKVSGGILQAVEELASSRPTRDGIILFLDEDPQIGQKRAGEVAKVLLGIDVETDPPIVDNSHSGGEGTVIYPASPELRERGIYYVENRRPGMPKKDGWVNIDGGDAAYRGTRAIVVVDPRCPRPSLATTGLGAVEMGIFIGCTRQIVKREVGAPQRLVCWAGMNRYEGYQGSKTRKS